MPIPLRFTLPDGGASRFVTPLIFVVAGVGTAIWFHLNAPWLVGWQRYAPYALGGFFVLVGLGSIVREIRRGAAMKAAQRALAEHRETPWLVRPEWRRNELSANGTLDWSFVRLAVLWNLFSWPLAYLLIQGEQGSGDRGVWVVALFPVVGLGMLGKVLFDVGRARKFGRTTVTLDPMPSRLGRQCRGMLQAEVGREAGPEDGFLVKVSCYRQRVRYRRDSDGRRKRRIERDLLWRDESRFDARPTVDGRTVEVPFVFDLPDDAPPSTPLKLDERIVWEVAAEADVPGIDFHARVEVPVFSPEPGSGDAKGMMGESPRQGELSHSAASSSSWGDADEPAEPRSMRTFDEPLTDGIVIVDEPGLFELHFTAARKRKGAIILGVMGVLFLVFGVPVMAASGAVGVILILMGAVFVYGSVQQGTNDTVLRVQDGRVVVAHDGIGMPADVDFPASQVEDVLVHLGTTSASDSATYSITLIARSEEGLAHLEEQASKAMDVMSRLGVGESHPAMEALRAGAERPTISVADELGDKDEAEWLAVKIKQAVEREVGRMV